MKFKKIFSILLILISINLKADVLENKFDPKPDTHLKKFKIHSLDRRPQLLKKAFDLYGAPNIIIIDEIFCKIQTDKSLIIIFDEEKWQNFPEKAIIPYHSKTLLFCVKTFGNSKELFHSKIKKLCESSLNDFDILVK